MEQDAIFVEDFNIRGMLYGLTIRSPVSRGKLVSVDCPRLPGTYTLITAANIPGTNQLNDFPVPVLAGHDLSYAGEPVALLVGPERAKLEEYLTQCTVKTEAEPPVYSPRSLAPPPAPVLARRLISLGASGAPPPEDIEKIFAEAPLVVDGVYTTGTQEHWYSEPTGAAAFFSRGKKGGNTLQIHTATQWPFHVKRSVAELLDIPSVMITVKPSCIGLHLDGKIWYPSLLACHAALGAAVTGKPVKIVLSRDEDFRFSPKRNGTEIYIRTALGEQGQILATEIRALADLGAQGVFTDEILDRTCLGALGIYNHGCIKIDGSAVSTNVPPAGPLSGFGLSQGFFAMECHVSRIADALRQDPSEWRKNNMITKGSVLAIGTGIADTIPLAELLDTTAAMGDYRRKWASYQLLREYRRGKKEIDKREPLRGIGIAAAYQGSGFLYSGTDKGNYGVELTLEKDGSLEIKTSMVSSSREFASIWRKIAEEILSVEASAVKVLVTDTDTLPDSGPSGLSRNITAITKLVERACVVIRKQRFRDPLPITVYRSYHPARIPNWEGKPMDQNTFSRPGWGAGVVEVEIDPIEYIPKIRGVWLGIDGGRILSESSARRSLRFSAIHALGWASREKLRYIEGVIPQADLLNYDLPTPEDIPPIQIDFIWNDTAFPKGIEELPFSCIPAAYVRAVSQAMDRPFLRIPITARDIWEAEKSKSQEKP